MAVGINGMGRIGRLVFRAAFGGVMRPEHDPFGGNRIPVVHINEAVGDVDTTAHLLAFDSLHGPWQTTVGSQGGDSLCVQGQTVTYSAEAEIDAVPWSALGCDIVLDCTGAFRRPDQLQAYFDAGVKRVIVAAPVHAPDALNIVFGVNHHLYDPDRHRVLTAASCTTNCLAPMVKVVHEAIGIRHGQITTIHNPTNTNVVVDTAHKDLRRARSTLNSLQPTTTGSARAIGLIYPDLSGKLNGHAVRVPVLNASLTDAVFELAEATTAADVNALMETAAKETLAGILAIEHRPLVSVDFLNNTHSVIVDAPSTLVTDGTQLKLYGWYDNEMGYACRMVDLAVLVLAKG